jgi:AhpC/TSA family protein
MMELEALQAVWPEFRALGASLVAISPQLPQYGRAVRRRAKLEFDVLTDLHLRVAEAFRLAFTLPAELKELYASFGNTLDKFHDEPDFRLPMLRDRDQVFGQFFRRRVKAWASTRSSRRPRALGRIRSATSLIARGNVGAGVRR